MGSTATKHGRASKECDHHKHLHRSAKSDGILCTVDSFGVGVHASSKASQQDQCLYPHRPPASLPRQPIRQAIPQKVFVTREIEISQEFVVHNLRFDSLSRGVECEQFRWLSFFGLYSTVSFFILVSQRLPWSSFLKAHELLVLRSCDPILREG